MKGLKILLGATALLGTLSASSDININSCTACHGKLFEKSAMGKSKIVSEMSKEDILASLKGFKDGTYGGPMKGLMKGQLMKFSDEQMVPLAEVIYTLNHTEESNSTEENTTETK